MYKEDNLLTIKELTTEKELADAFPIMKQLRSHLNLQTYLELVAEAQIKEDYKMFALSDNGELVALIGFMPMITLYYGHIIWVCDLVTDKNKRSKGYGDKLLTYTQNWARGKGYESIALSSGLQRVDAHRFYEDKMNYKRVSYVFKRNID